MTFFFSQWLKWVWIFLIFFGGFFIHAAYGEEPKEINQESENANADLVVHMEDIYMQTYKSLSLSKEEKTPAEKKTLITLATQLGVEKEDVSTFLNGSLRSLQNCVSSGSSEVNPNGCFPKIVQKYCNNENGLDFSGYIECQKKLQSLYSGMLQKEVFAAKIGKYSQINQLFLNGTMEDTGNEKFDIIVDLNILDVILFGDKADFPQNESVFFPEKKFEPLKNRPDESKEGTSQSANEIVTGESSGSNNSSSSNSESNNSASNTSNQNSSHTQTTTQDTNQLSSTHTASEKFCIDPDALLFQANISPKNNQDNSKTEGDSADKSSNGVSNDNSSSNGNSNADGSNNGGSNLSAESQKLGEYFLPENIRYGGSYPDLDGIIQQEKNDKKRVGCKDGEQPLFGGRMCIKEFCNDLVCVSINIKKGNRKTALRPLDCVECHIDRGNEALTPLRGTLGQNTPNINPMEPNFLSAFANFSGGFSSGLHIDLQPKKLPFLIYDTSLTDQKKNTEKTENEKIQDQEKKHTEDEDESIRKNTELYKKIIFDCSRGAEGVYNRGTTEEAALFCNKYQKELTQSKSQEQKEKEQKNKTKSEGYKNVVEPFFYGFSADMEQINRELQNIHRATIDKSAQKCRSLQ